MLRIYMYIHCLFRLERKYFPGERKKNLYLRNCLLSNCLLYFENALATSSLYLSVHSGDIF